MNNLMNEQLETQLRSLASDYPYPPAPDLRSRVIEHTHPGTSQTGRTIRRMAWALVILVVAVIITSFAVPSVRAMILEFIQVGGIRIYTEPTTTPPATLQTYPSIDDLVGETTLDKLRAEFTYPLPLPTYPPDLGEPDRVFLQDLDGQAALLVWMDPHQPGNIRMNLLVLGPGAFAEKGMPNVLEETTVNGHRAIWMQGSHFLHLGGSFYQNVPLVVDGSILAWEVDGITYRLQTDLTLDEAVRVAESFEE